MKKWIGVLAVMVLVLSLLPGCGGQPAQEGALVVDENKPETAPVTEAPVTDAPATKMPVETDAPATEAPSEAPTEEPAAPSAAEELYALMEATGSLTDMAPYTDADLLNLYGIDPAACVCAAGYVNTAGKCDQVVIAVALDEAGADNHYALLSAHVERLLEQYNGYDAEAYATVKKAELYRDGNAVVLIVSPEAKALAGICGGFTF